MAFSLGPVNAHDVNALVREVEYPAHQNNPLYLIMFPRAAKHDEEREQEIKWMIEGLSRTVLKNNDETLRKACAASGLLVGFIGWVIDTSKYVDTSKRKENTAIAHQVNFASKHDAPREKNRNSWCPATMDAEGWLRVSKQLREERQRVLQQCNVDNGVCRITSMAVNPDYQRQGIGSILMQSVCDEIDERGLDAFVMSSPAGIRLYSKFGFKAVGTVRTNHGVFTSMLRTAKSSHLKLTK
ncbi:hypothetical protein Plec18167_008723 [Paecilomyces lecythidis]|uniref:N-acetyltransferase domain-containing protein n=1 Tax=Paecilomyces lecythidis TaxID=3004212 RepID=A0ABR3WU49_9EURO